MNSFLPAKIPNYYKPDLNPYNYIQGTNNLDPVYHFAPDLVELIRKHKNQEIGTHTFSHYYCLEEGQTIDEFSCDIESAINIAKAKGISIKSLVFPRNAFDKFNSALLLKYVMLLSGIYLPICSLNRKLLPNSLLCSAHSPYSVQCERNF